MKIDEDLAELLGIHIGDGCISRTKRYAEYYLGGDITEEREYHDSWVGPLFNKKIMQPVLQKNVIYKEHPKVGVYGFYIFNDKLVSFFEKLGIKAGTKLPIEVPVEIRTNKRLTKRFLRGLFDTDGTIYFDKNRSCKHPINNRPTIKLGGVSRELISQVYCMLKNLGLHPRLTKPYKGKRDKNFVHGVLIYRKEDINYFIKQIGFKNTKHSTKWEIFRLKGYCTPYTTINQRKVLLQNFIRE